MAELLKGAPVAAAITEELIPRVEALRARGIVPTLAIVRVGERPDDLSYEGAAMRRCAKIGVEVKRSILPAGCSRLELTAAIEHINAASDIHGCLMLRPLPDKAMEEAVCALLSPEKDVDGMTAGSMAAVFTGRGPGYPPCTAQAVMELLDHYGVELAGKRAVVVGRSLVIGRPLGMLLLGRDATVTICHTRTADLPQECRNAEILVAAAGRAGTIGADHLSPGQIVVDVGASAGEDGKLRGDVDLEAAQPVVSAVTPVPGGVGAVTTAVLCRHTVQAAERAAQK